MATAVHNIGTNGNGNGKDSIQGFEYEYEYEASHLEESAALERYKREKTLHPQAIVTLDERGCGHYEVKVYSTEKEKQTHYQQTLARIMERLWNALK